MADLKTGWKARIRKLKTDSLTVQAIAGIIGCHPSRIYRDLENGSFEGASKNGRGKKSCWNFTHEDACNYVDSFRDTIPAKDQTPPSKKIPIPGWEWE